MIELEKDVYYLKKCQHCSHIEKYIMRADNVNEMPDKDVIDIANRNLGTSENEICQDCGLYTQHTITGYRWRTKVND